MKLRLAFALTTSVLSTVALPASAADYRMITEDLYHGTKTYSTLRHYSRHQTDLANACSGLIRGTTNYAEDFVATHWPYWSDDFRVKRTSCWEASCKQDGPYRRANTKLKCTIHSNVELEEFPK